MNRKELLSKGYVSCLDCEYLGYRDKDGKFRDPKGKEPKPCFGCCRKGYFINEFDLYVRCKDYKEYKPTKA